MRKICPLATLQVDLYVLRVSEYMGDATRWNIVIVEITSCFFYFIKYKWFLLSFVFSSFHNCCFSCVIRRHFYEYTYCKLPNKKLWREKNQLKNWNWQRRIAGQRCSRRGQFKYLTEWWFTVIRCPKFTRLRTRVRCAHIYCLCASTNFTQYVTGARCLHPVCMQSNDHPFNVNDKTCIACEILTNTSTVDIYTFLSPSLGSCL